MLTSDKSVSAAPSVTASKSAAETVSSSMFCTFSETIPCPACEASNFSWARFSSAIISSSVLSSGVTGVTESSGTTPSVVSAGLVSLGVPRSLPFIKTSARAWSIAPAPPPIAASSNTPVSTNSLSGL